MKDKIDFQYKEWSSNRYFIISAPIVGIVALLSIFYPKEVESVIVILAKFSYTLLDWAVLWIPLFVLIVCLIISFSKAGKIRLGGKDSKPEYKYFSWIAMVFSGGIGIGIVFFGPIEAMWHYTYSNYSALPGINADQRAHMAMSTTVWLWGLPVWSVYAIAAAIISYFAYNKKTVFSPAPSLYISFSNHRWGSILAKFAIAMTIIVTGISLASSLSIAARQLNSGLSAIFSINGNYGIIILIVIYVLYTVISLTPIRMGMRHLSNITIITALTLLMFIFLVGPTRYFMMNVVEAVGNSVMGTIKQSFNLFIFDKNRYWIDNFAMSYFIWWIGWTPFMGIFIAKISKGRTLKELILSVIFLPSLLMIFWFSVFSGYSLLNTIQGDGSLIKVANSSNYEGTIYKLLEKFPLSTITKPILALLFIAFITTTMVSACVTLGILTGKDGKKPDPIRTFIWATFIAFIASPFVLSGKIEGIKAIGSLIGLPYVFLFLIMIAALIKTLRKDTKEVKI